jgi:hypothetical protein
MGIEIRPSGEAAAYASAGQIIGAGQRAEEERARADEQAARNQQLQAQDMARQWEVQKMLLNSQQDFSHEQRMRQVELDKEARSHEWELQKAEIASRMDFEQQEKERIRRTAAYTAGRDVINENEGLSKEQKDAANFRLSSKYPDIPEAAAGLGMNPREQQAQTTVQKRRELEAIIGPELGKLMSLDELQAEADRITGTASRIPTTPNEQTNTNGITATNPTTGEKQISYDGGNTWQPFEPAISKLSRPAYNGGIGQYGGW